MNITTIPHPESVFVLTAAGIIDQLVPSPGFKSCAAISKLADDEWCITANNDGEFSMMVLTDCTEQEAHDLHRNMGSKFENARLVYTGEAKAECN